MRSPLSFLLGFLVALGLGGGVAYAATGGSFVLGQPNEATATTSISNPAGTALALNSPDGVSPLKVNQNAKVTRLNADYVDGANASEFALKSGKSGVVVGSENDADGFVNTAKCPTGSVATGGGGYASGTRDYLYYSGPDYRGDGSFVPNSWFAAADGDTIAWVVCYNPRGAVPNASTSSDLGARGLAVRGSQKELP